MDIRNKVSFSIIPAALLFVGAVFITNPVAADTNIDFSATIAPSLSVTISSGTAHIITDAVQAAAGSEDSSVAINDIMPSGAGTLKYSDLNLSVFSNSNSGYVVNMVTESTSLVGIHTGAEIATLDEKEGGYTSDNFTSDRWGYAVGTIEDGNVTFGNYFAAHEGMNVLASSAGTANGKDLIVRLGAKLDYLATPDTYTTTLNFNIVANLDNIINE